MPFPFQPTLVGDLLALRPLERGDDRALYRVASDPRIWEQHPASNRHEGPHFRAFFEDSLASGGALIATEATGGAVIGSSRFHGYDEAASEVEIGWTFLARAYWGGAYNGEMKRLMLRHAFRYVDAVLLLVGPDNVRSQRAVERIGARREGLRRDGTGLVSHLYRIRASEFDPDAG